MSHTSSRYMYLPYLNLCIFQNINISVHVGIGWKRVKIGAERERDKWTLLKPTTATICDLWGTKDQND